MFAVRRLTLAAALFAVATMSFSGTPQDAQLDQALQGAWCDSDDAGLTCRGYEECRKGVIFGCGIKPETGDNYPVSMRYTVQGVHACGVATASTVVPSSASGEQVCKEILGFNDDTMNFRLEGRQKVMTAYRVPRDPMTCLGPQN